MFAGHIGAAFVIGRAERRINVATFIFFALLLDVLLWLFVLTGAESVSMPADFARTHQPAFVFPYSHGLAASVLWSVLAALFAWGAYRPYKQARARAAALIGLAVFSHYVLDLIVHRPEMPLLGQSSSKFGFGLYLSSLPGALVLEAMLALLGLAIYLPGLALPRGRKIGLAALVLAVAAMTLGGMLGTPPASPSPYTLAGGSLALIMAVCLIARRLGKRPAAPKA